MQMKVVTALLALGACTTTGGSQAGSYNAGSALSELTGILLYEGEFQIYPSQEALNERRAGGPSNCISGVFSRVEQQEPESRRYSGKRVRLVGRYEDWAPYREIWLRMDPLIEGTPILQNHCGADRVFVAEEAYPAD